MTLDDMVDVLTKCAAYDQRTVGRLDVVAWHEILRRVERADALEAVSRHYAETTMRAMPADILKLSRMVRDERERLDHKAEPRALTSRFEQDDFRDIRLREGVQQCREVIEPILDRLAEQRRSPEDGPRTRSDIIRERALEVARVSRKGRKA